MSEADIKHLLDLGFSQTAVHDAVQVISYFNYINRIADALDVDLEMGTVTLKATKTILSMIVSHTIKYNAG